MPKTPNTHKKCAAALANSKVLSLAYDARVPIIFAGVEKKLGQSQFRLRVSGGGQVSGTPRGLFTAGTLKIEPGQIVVIEAARPGMIHEIVGRIDQRKDAVALVKMGRLPKDVMEAMSSIGVCPEAPATDDLFELAEEAPLEGEGQDRRAAEVQASVDRLIQRVNQKHASRETPTEDTVDIDAI
jgi:hypothetical protein